MYILRAQVLIFKGCYYLKLQAERNVLIDIMSYFLLLYIILHLHHIFLLYTGAVRCGSNYLTP